jgi:Mn2+/Fe2+ NRAMP family transporter
MPNASLVAVIVLIVIVVASAPIVGIFVWLAGHRVSKAREDVQAEKKHARTRLRFLLFLYGGVASVFLGVGLAQAVTGQLVGLIIGLWLIAQGVVYATVLYRAAVHHERSRS